METASREHNADNMGGKQPREVSGHMGQPEWKNQSTDRLHHDKCKTTKYSTQGAEQHLLARKHESEPTAPSTDNATLLQRSEEIQETDTD